MIDGIDFSDFSYAELQEVSAEVGRLMDKLRQSMFVTKYTVWRNYNDDNGLECEIEERQVVQEDGNNDWMCLTKIDAIKKEIKEAQEEIQQATKEYTMAMEQLGKMLAEELKNAN